MLTTICCGPPLSQLLTSSITWTCFTEPLPNSAPPQRYVNSSSLGEALWHVLFEMLTSRNLLLLVPHNVCRTEVCAHIRASHQHLCSTWDYGCRYEYLWEDGIKYKRPTKLAAPEYVDALMNWAQNILDDEAVFPNKIGNLFLFLMQVKIQNLIPLQVFLFLRISAILWRLSYGVYSAYMHTFIAITLIIYVPLG